MRVKVLYFGVLKDLAGVDEETVEIADGADIAALYHHLRKRPSNEEVWRSLAVAVNREYAGPATLLRDGDEVALLPPVSGGHCAANGEKLVALAKSFLAKTAMRVEVDAG